MIFNPSKCEVLTVTRKKQLTLFNYSMHFKQSKKYKISSSNNNFGPEFEQEY